MNFKYNELAYAKLIYDKGFQTKHIPTELRLLALYYKNVLGYNHKQREIELEKFCERHLEGFNLAKHYVVIDRALARCKNKNINFVVVKSIPVLKSEVDYINSLDIKYDYKKILFAFLVQNKIERAVYLIKYDEDSDSKYFKGGKKRYNDVKQMAKVPQNLKINEGAIHDLSLCGLIEPKHKGLVGLSFLDKIPESDDGEIAIEIKVFEDTGWYFDYYNNIKRVKLCKKCGQPFKANSNSQEYCKSHKPDYIPIETKKVFCIDCDTEIMVKSKNTKTIRCDICQNEHKKKYDRERKNKSNSV